MQERQFTPEEAQKVIELSMRLQVQWSEHVTLAEIEKSASECGVDPRFVHLAVQQLDAPPAETNRKPKPKIGGPSLALGIYTAIFSVVVCAFCVHVITANQQIMWEDATLPAVMAVVFGLAARVQRRPVLAFIPILSTFAMSIAALILLASTHGRIRGPGTLEDLLAAVFWQMILAGAGYGLAKLAEHLQQGARRSMTN